MRIPGVDQAIGHLIKWSEKDEWEPYRRQVFAEHFELIMERFDISEQEIVDLRAGSPSCRRGRIAPKNARTVQPSP